MTEAQTALARRAVACKGWRWSPGMLTDEDLRVVSVHEQHRYLHVHPGSLLLHVPQEHLLPDLTDPATRGCILALVREAWESPKANLSWVTDDKCMVVFDTGHAQKFLLASTEAEALVLALEGAP